MPEQLPVCVGNLLDQRDYHYVNWARTSHSSRLVSKTHPHYSCRLLEYTAKRAVTCFDYLSQLNTQNVNRKFPNLHFVFMGDSRMRQQFFYFLKVLLAYSLALSIAVISLWYFPVYAIQLIPDYDRITQPMEIPRNVVPFHHGDVDVDSSVNRLRVSFKWRPIINDTVIEMIRSWTASDRRPNLILLSVYHHLFCLNLKLY